MKLQNVNLVFERTVINILFTRVSLEFDWWNLLKMPFHKCVNGMVVFLGVCKINTKLFSFSGLSKKEKVSVFAFPKCSHQRRNYKEKSYFFSTILERIKRCKGGKYKCKCEVFKIFFLFSICSPLLPVMIYTTWR